MSFVETSGDFVEVKLLWHKGVNQNYLPTKAALQRIEFRLHVFDRGDEAGLGARDRESVILAVRWLEVIQ